MASIRFAGLVFGVIIISLAQYSFACAQEAGSGATRKNRWVAGIESQNQASSQNDFLDGVSEAEVANIAGRKVLKGRTLEVIYRPSKQQLDKKSNLPGDPVSGKISEAATASQDSAMEAKVSTESVDHHHHLHEEEEEEADAYEILPQNRGDYAHRNPPHKKPPVNNNKPKN